MYFVCAQHRFQINKTSAFLKIWFAHLIEGHFWAWGSMEFSLSSLFSGCLCSPGQIIVICLLIQFCKCIVFHLVKDLFSLYVSLVVWISSIQLPFMASHFSSSPVLHCSAEPDFTKCDMFLDQHLCWPWNNIVINQSDLKNKFIIFVKFRLIIRVCCLYISVIHLLFSLILGITHG